MLNLVQLQERLKDVPMQALMQYANGANPQVPPFLALGELNRRKKMQESAAADQAQEMEGSTVKQQIEQAAGLMALQGSRQRQAAQQQQGIQAAMPMAAPNTTTSEPAQLAGGGFIDDIVVPRDYQRGGAVNPEMLKRLMMMKAMQNRRPGVAGLPINTFKRGDFAGGGIVAFAGQEGSFVETRPGFYELESETKQESLASSRPQELLEEIVRRRKERQSLENRMREAGLLEPPGPTEELAALEAQKQRRREADTLARRVMSVDPLRIGRSMAEYLSKEEAAETAIEDKKAKARDLHASAKFNAAKGNIKDAIADEREADKTDKEIATAMGDVGYKGALADQALAGRTSNLREMYKTELAGLVAEGKDPNDPRVQREANRRAAYYVATLAGPRVDVAGQQADIAARREETQDYEAAARIVDPMIGPGGSLYKEYKKKRREEGQAAADAFRKELIDQEIARMRRRQGGAQPQTAPTTAPTTGTLPAGLPPGSKQIGTSGGKAVYQLPNGQKVVAQ